MVRARRTATNSPTLATLAAACPDHGTVTVAFTHRRRSGETSQRAWNRTP
ncbi:hypothetical protein ACWCPS_18735 [Streptomyces mauvecolor]